MTPKDLRCPLIVLVVVDAFAVFSLPPLAAQQSRVTVVALTVKKPAIQRPSRLESGLESGMPSGTTLSVLLTRPDKYFISIREGSTHLLAFHDNKGTNLLTKTAGAVDSENRDAELSMEVSNNGHTCELEVSAPGIPAKGATTVTATSRLVLLCGSQPTSVSAQRIMLKVGSQLVVGPVSMHISAIDRQANKTTVTFASTHSFVQIKRLAFFAPNGHPLQIDGTGNNEISSDKHVIYENSYDFSSLPDAVTVKAVYFKKVEDLPVTYSVKTGLGF